jgi:glycosyltransferase involved in cell wall biosynthesis
LKKLSSTQYLLNICIAEGFGLVPLEAMSRGVVVIGLDALGGKDYFIRNHNSITYNFKEIKKFVADFAVAHKKIDSVQTISLNAIQTSAKYNYENFYAAWKNQLQIIL